MLTQDPMLDLHDLVEYYPETAPAHLDLAIRGIIGLDAEAVHERSPPSSSKHPTLTRRSRSGSWACSRTTSPDTASIEVARLYEPPFTTLHTDSIDGLFPDDGAGRRASSS